MSKIETIEVDYMELFKTAISEAKKQIIGEEYQKETSDAEVLGILVSKFSKWGFEDIEEVARAAFEDSNFSNVTITDADD